MTRLQESSFFTKAWLNCQWIRCHVVSLKNNQHLFRSWLRHCIDYKPLFKPVGITPGEIFCSTRLRNYSNKFRSVFYELLNILGPRRCGSDYNREIRLKTRLWNYFHMRIFNSSQIDILSTSSEIGLRWVPKNPIDKSNCFSQWLDTVRKHVITRANVDPDLCRQMDSLGHNELNVTLWEHNCEFERIHVVMQWFNPLRPSDAYMRH